MGIDEILRPISRTTLAGEIFERILGLIMDGKLAPGEKLPPERELAEKLGVGRASVREALRALSMLGALDARPGPGGGTFVNGGATDFFLSPFILRESITNENASELMEARLILEATAAGLAAERGSKKEKDLIRQCFDNMVSAKDDPERSVEEDWCFHRAIVQAAHNLYLLRIFVMIGYLIREWISMSKSYDEDISYTMRVRIQGHQGILNAIEAGEANAARGAMERHLKKAVERLLKNI